MILHVSITIGDIKRVDIDSIHSLSAKEKKYIIKMLSGRLIADVDALPPGMQLKIKDEVIGAYPEKKPKRRRKRNLRKYKLELEFNRIRGSILERDGHTCQKCGRREHLHVHHVQPLGEGGDNSSNNLITLCRDCHKEEHAEEPVAKIM